MSDPIEQWMRDREQKEAEFDRRIRGVGADAIPAADLFNAAPTVQAIGGAGAWSSVSSAWKWGRVVTLQVNVTTAAGGAANVDSTAALPVGWRPPSNLYLEAVDAGSGNPTSIYLTAGGTVRHVFARAAGAGTLGLFCFVATN